MEVSLALVADAANRSEEGKLNILGAFSNLFAVTYPVRHPEMQLVLRMEASVAEVGTLKKFKVLLLDADGNPKHTRVEGEFTVPPANRAGSRVYMETVIRMVDTTFEKQGDYSLAILINEEEKASIPLTVGPPPRES